METIACKALKAFTHFVPDYGQVHGDPDNSDEAARNPMVPVTVVDQLVGEGAIEKPGKGGQAAAGAKAGAKPGKGGGKKDEAAFDPAPFTVAAGNGIGVYEVTGPGLDAPVSVKGKAQMQARVAELMAAQPPAGAGDAPVD